MAEANGVTVQDNPAENLYELLLDGIRVGMIHYLPTRGAIVVVHTEVAAELEGQGLGGRLVAGALEDLRARGLRLIPVCPFVASYVRRHPEYADLVAQEPSAPE